MGELPLLRAVDAVTVPVPDLDAGLVFYQEKLGHQLLWRNDDIGQAGLALRASSTELVLTTRAHYAPTWLVSSVDDAVDAIAQLNADYHGHCLAARQLAEEHLDSDRVLPRLLSLAEVGS